MTSATLQSASDCQSDHKGPPDRRWLRIDKDVRTTHHQTRGGPERLRWFWSLTVNGPMMRLGR
jgi:hypothetical protein